MRNLKSKLVKIFLTITILLGINTSCGDKNLIVPYVYVDFEVDLNQPDMQELISIGGFVFVHGGHKGIVIYHNSIDEYSAYDRACTHHPNVGRVQQSDEWSTLTCDSCESKFFLHSDAIPIQEPATIALHKYRVYYNAGAKILRISN